ncbi:MAG: hypothetical protein RSD28_03350 [Lachnospiraceae bacterium]
MKNISIAVCDKDRIYGTRLAEWIMQERKDRFDSYYFSQWELFSHMQKEQKFEIVLLGREFLNNNFLAEEHTMWFYLYDETQELEEEYPEIPVVDKYQPASEILRQVFGYYQKKREESPSTLSEKKELIGVYAPDRSIWQIPFSMILAQTLSGKEQVLYVNFMECTGFFRWFETCYQKDFLDEMYQMLESEQSFITTISSVVYSMEGFDYIPPAMDGELLGELTREQYQKFVNILRNQNVYDVVILDFGSMIPGFFQLLDSCSKIYITREQGMMSQGMAEQFEENIKRHGTLKLSDKIKQVEFPRMQRQYLTKEHLMQQWLWGEMGDYVRKLVGA